MIVAGTLRLLRGGRLRTVAVAALLGCALLVGSLVGARRHGAAVAPTRGVQVVVATTALPAGRAIDPARLRLVPVSAAAVPRGALRRLDQAAFRVPRIMLPAGLPLADALLAEPGATIVLRPGERAVGLRVDEASALRGVLASGVRVDVVAASRGVLRTLAVDVPVASVGGATEDGARRLVVVRVDAARARALAAADLAGLELRLLVRGGP